VNVLAFRRAYAHFVRRPYEVPMNRSYLLSSLCTTLALASPVLLSGQSNGKQLQGLLPQGRVNVEVLEMWSPPGLAVLTQRLQQAAQADPTWFQEQVRRAVPGQPLPYHPKLGLTESEYQEFLALSDSVQMKPVRTAHITVEPTRVGWRFWHRNLVGRSAKCRD
jgi:hypothetical protein